MALCKSKNTSIDDTSMYTIKNQLKMFFAFMLITFSVRASTYGRLLICIFCPNIVLPLLPK